MAKKMVLTETELHSIIKESVQKAIFGNYNIDSVDEIMEYMWLKPNVTQLCVDIFVDDGGSYLRHNHELLLLVRNGYDKNVSEFIPFSVSHNPIVLDDTIDFMISYDDIFEVQDFIVANVELLQALANRKIGQIAFVQSLRIPSYALCEEKKLLTEMATLKKEDTNLPMDIWVD